MSATTLFTNDPPEAGWPDPALIARLANELFAALPGQPVPGTASSPPATPVEIGALPIAPALPPASALAPPTEADVRPLPATLLGATPPSPQAGVSVSAFPLGPYEFRPELVPDTGVAALPATPPVEVGALPSATAPAPATPTEADLRALPATLASPAGLPAQPGIAAPEYAGSHFYFLDEIQPVSPRAAPALSLDLFGFPPELIPDLGITAGPYGRG